jgi:hypothetical protein
VRRVDLHRRRLVQVLEPDIRYNADDTHPLFPSPRTAEANIFSNRILVRKVELAHALTDDRDGRMLRIILVGKGAASQNRRTDGLEIIRRDLEKRGVGTAFT